MFVHRLMNEHREEMEYRIKVAELAFNYPDRFALAMRADVDSWMSITCANIDEPGERMYHILNHVLVNGSFIIKDLTSALSVVMPDRKVEDTHEQLITNTSIKRIRFV
jgi:hypothetical protein